MMNDEFGMMNFGLSFLVHLFDLQGLSAVED